MKLWIAQNDATGDFYLTDDPELASHGSTELTEVEYLSYRHVARDYDTWQLHIAARIRANQKEKFG